MRKATMIGLSLAFAALPAWGQTTSSIVDLSGSWRSLTVWTLVDSSGAAVGNSKVTNNEPMTLAQSGLSISGSIESYVLTGTLDGSSVTLTEKLSDNDIIYQGTVVDGDHIRGKANYRTPIGNMKMIATWTAWRP